MHYSSTRRTWAADHLTPPWGARTPRACNAAATCRKLAPSGMAPSARIPSSTARSSADRACASSPCATRAVPAPAGVPGRSRGLPSQVPRASAAASAARVRYPVSPASNSATAAICVSRTRPIGPGGTWGRSQNITPASPAPSTRLSKLGACRRAPALDLLELGQQLAPMLRQVGGGLPLRLQAQPGPALTLGADAKVGHEPPRRRGSGQGCQPSGNSSPGSGAWSGTRARIARRSPGFVPVPARDSSAAASARVIISIMGSRSEGVNPQPR